MSFDELKKLLIGPS
jgi:hypothetical protein